MSRFELSSLSVGDKVGYMSSYSSHYYDAKAATVTKVLKTQIVIHIDGREPKEGNHSFMKESGREVGASSWRSAYLINFEAMQNSKTKHAVYADQLKKIKAVDEVVKQYLSHDQILVSAEDKQKLISLVSSL